MPLEASVKISKISHISHISLFTYYVELVSHCGLHQRTFHASAMFVMNALDGLGASVLKYHAHIFDITRKKEKSLLEMNNQHGKHR